MGREYVWSCPGCATAMCASQAPDACEAKCLRCRTDDASLERLHALRSEQRDITAEWVTRALSAEREVERLKERLGRLEADERRSGVRLLEGT